MELIAILTIFIIFCIIGIFTLKNMEGIVDFFFSLRKPKTIPYIEEAKAFNDELFLDFIYDLYQRTTPFEKIEDTEKYHTLYTFEKNLYKATVKTNLFHSHIEFWDRKERIFSILFQKIDGVVAESYIHPNFKYFSFQMNHAKDVLTNRSFDSAVETKTLEELHFLQRTLHKLAIYHLDNQFKQIEESYLFLESYKVHLSFDENHTIEHTLIRDFKHILSAYYSLKEMNEEKALHILEESIGLLVEKTNNLKLDVSARCLTQLEKEKNVLSVR